jgi:superfamily II DNA or RNA helicase
VKNKDENSLIQQVGEITDHFEWEEPLLPSSISLEEAVGLTAIELSARFPSRYAYYQQLYRMKRSGNLTQQDIAQAELWFGMMNSLSDHSEAMLANPEATILYDAQMPVFHSLHDFMEVHGRGDARGYIRLPTGSGKTVLFTEFARVTGLRALVVTPSRLLVDQTDKTIRDFTEAGLEVGKIYGPEKTIGQDVTITTYASLMRQLKLDQKDALINPLDYDLLLLDEAHMALGEETRRTLQAFDHAIQIGFTATPDYGGDMYLRKRELNTLLPNLIHEMSIPEAVRLGLLSPFQVGIMQTDIDLSDVPIYGEEYDQEILERFVNATARNKAAVELYLAAFMGRKAVGFCAGVEHAMELARVFQDHGIAADFIHGGMTHRQQVEIKDRLKYGAINGGINVVFNAQILTMGFDEPSIEVCLELSPSFSPVRVQQRAGRALRTYAGNPNKVAMLIEFIDADNRRPPYLFPDKKIAGTSYIAPKGQKKSDPPPLSTFDRWECGGAIFITNPSDVNDIAESFSKRRSENWRKPPEGWATAAMIAEANEWPVTLTRNTLRRLAQAEGKWFEARSGRFVSNDNKGASYFGPEIQLKLAEVIKLPPPPPAHWRTVQQLAAMYGLPEGRIRTAMRRITKVDDSRYGLFTAERGSQMSRLFYAPEAQQELAEGFELAYSNGYPPQGWSNDADLIELLGEKDATRAILGTHGRWPRLRINHKLMFTNPETGKEDVYYSPHAVEQFARFLAPPPKWSTLSDLVDMLGEDQDIITSLMEELEATKPQIWGKHTRECMSASGKRSVYLSPLAARKLKSLLRSRMSRISEVVMPAARSDGQRIEGWQYVDELPTRMENKLQKFAERAIEIRQAHGRAVIVGKKVYYQVSGKLIYAVSTLSPKAVNIPEDWYHPQEIADTFGLDSDEVVKTAKQLMKTWEGRPPVKRFYFERACDEFYGPDFTSSLLVKLGIRSQKA